MERLHDQRARSASGKPSFDFVPALPVAEEPAMPAPPMPSQAPFYIMLGIMTLLGSVAAWHYIGKIENRLGSRAPEVLKSMGPRSYPSSASPTSSPINSQPVR